MGIIVNTVKQFKDGSGLPEGPHIGIKPPSAGDFGNIKSMHNQFGKSMDKFENGTL